MTSTAVSEDVLRVAFFPDSYHEIDGVANTSRQFEAFAHRRGLPFLVVHGVDDGGLCVSTEDRLALPRGKISIALDKKHDFDALFLRHLRQTEEWIRDFNPDIIHVTGPSDVGLLGTLVAHRLRIPLAASWHTNLHQYAQQRSASFLSWLPPHIARPTGAAIRELARLITLRFYHIAQILYAPNQELIELVEKGTRKPCFLMERGVDTTLFDPARRDRSDHQFTIGFVGRLTIEKNVRLLVDLEHALIRAGLTNFKFLIVGQGAEEPYLRTHLQNAEFTGVLTGEPLRRAYANMDVFVFPSQTDTYGNVVLEALASGVPAVVSDQGGPRYIVRHGETGYIASNSEDFENRVLTLARNPGQLAMMRLAARQHALSSSWDKVFEYVYAGYERGLRSGIPADKKVRTRRRRTVLSGAV
jgi:glycosyltransferase involved in cell wall biosynthesis